MVELELVYWRLTLLKTD
jgi:hypothetical protein